MRSAASRSLYAWELVTLGRQLGRQSGDLRFYLSGMVQARLLDDLSPGWKARVMDSGAHLEELLRTSVGPSSPR